MIKIRIFSNTFFNFYKSTSLQIKNANLLKYRYLITHRYLILYSLYSLAGLAIAFIFNIYQICIINLIINILFTVYKHNIYVINIFVMI